MEKLLEILKGDEDKDPIEPEEIRMRYPNITEEQMNFLMAMIAVYQSDAPWNEYHIFEKTALALNFIIPDFDNLEGIEAGQIWRAVKLMKQVRSRKEFSWEVKKYIQAVSNEEGVYVYPPELNMTEDDEVMEKINYKIEAGPFPLSDKDFYEIQAAKYLGIQQYLIDLEQTSFDWLQ